MNNDALIEHLIGIRQQLRNLQAQVTFLLEQATAEDPREGKDGDRMPATFGSRKDIEDASR
jgi:hypothetical protein